MEEGEEREVRTTTEVEASYVQRVPSIVRSGRAPEAMRFRRRGRCRSVSRGWRGAGDAGREEAGVVVEGVSEAVGFGEGAAEVRRRLDDLRGALAVAGEEAMAGWLDGGWRGGRGWCWGSSWGSFRPAVLFADCC